MLEFQLFRIKVLASDQMRLLNDALGPRELLSQVLASRPEAELRPATWHIGNIERLDDAGLYFRVGKTTRATIEAYRDGVFQDEEFEISPYTHALLDLDLELAAIAKKARLAPKTAGIARQLSRLLNEAPLVRQQDATVEISDIQDPEDFITYIREAYSIFKFSMSFSRPNPFDANQDFVQPLQKCLAESNGEKGKVEMKGEALKSAPLEELARSAATTGDDASARLKSSQRARPVTRHLKGKAVTVSEEDVAQPEQKRDLLRQIREIYRRIRGQAG